VNRRDRERFDALLEEALEALPEGLIALLDEAALIVDDRPDGAMLKELGMTEEEATELCGLFSGLAHTERSVEHSAEMPDDIRIFREGIVALAGGWEQEEADDEVYEEIMITLLHEIGHRFGLNEEDLKRLGYD
jgi:predicted Zn-dependent protease with MMP-like domain